MNAAFAIDIDDETVVVDDPDAEAIMQVLIDGEWHRRLPDLSHTACALRLGPFFNVRPEKLAGRLCELCFTPFERSQAKGTHE